MTPVFEAPQRLRGVAEQMGFDAHLVGHFSDRFLAEIGGELRVDGVVGGERGLHEVDRLVQRGALEGVHFVVRFGGQPTFVQGVGEVVGGVRVHPARERVGEVDRLEGRTRAGGGLRRRG